MEVTRAMQECNRNEDPLWRPIMKCQWNSSSWLLWPSVLLWSFSNSGGMRGQCKSATEMKTTYEVPMKFKQLTVVAICTPVIFFQFWRYAGSKVS